MRRDWPRGLRRWLWQNRTPLILAGVALAIYIPGIWWGLPFPSRPERVRPWGADELGPLGPVAELYNVFFGHATRFNRQYPLFHYFIQAVFCAPYLAWLRVTGGMSTPSGTFPYGLTDPAHSIREIYLFARIPSLLMGAGVVMAAYYTAARMWNRSAALLAAILVLLMYPMFFYARTGHVDMAALFWTSLGLLVFAAALCDGLTVRRAVWLGIWTACAVGSKDATYALFAGVALVLLPLHVIRMRAGGATVSGLIRAPLAGLLTAGVAYSITSGLLFEPARWFQHVGFIIHGSDMPGGYYSTPATLAGYLDLLRSSVWHLAAALSLPVVIAGIIGVVLTWRRSPRLAFFAAPTISYLVGVILPVRFVFFRFLFFPAYIVALFAGFAFAALLGAQNAVARRGGWLAVASVAAWMLLRAADLTNQMVNDSRYALADWLAVHARAGDRIAHHGLSWKLPALAASIETVGEFNVKSSRDAELPEWYLVMPYQESENEHEWTMSDDEYRALRTGRAGYRLAIRMQTPTLFALRPISWVNPPIEVYLRNDLQNRLNP